MVLAAGGALIETGAVGTLLLDARHDERLDYPVALAIRGLMGIVATIMNTATGQPIQKFTFGRMPKPWVSFNLASGELVKADRVEVGKPAPGSFAAPVTVWVTPK